MKKEAYEISFGFHDVPEQMIAHWVQLHNFWIGIGGISPPEYKRCLIEQSPDWCVLEKKTIMKWTHDGKDMETKLKRAIGKP